MPRLIAIFFIILTFSITGQGRSTPQAALTPTPDGAVHRWQPVPQTTFDWQLGDTVDTSIDAQVYDIDLFSTDAKLVAALHAQGRKVICYINVGAWEDFRPDKDMFPHSVIGKDYVNWKGEKWLDIRQIKLLDPIMQARLDLCQAKGFDAVEPDNIDGYATDTGFPLTADDQLSFNRWIAQEAHKRGLSIGLKNDSAQVSDMLSSFDWALTEDCFQQGWCNQVMPFIQDGKAVFATEYTDTGIKFDAFCSLAQRMKFSLILKNRALDSFRKDCQ